MQQQTSSSTSHKYTSAVSRQASAMLREQSSAGEIVRAPTNYAYLQPTATTSYQATSYAAQPNTTSASYQSSSYQATQPTTTTSTYQATSYAAQPTTTTASYQATSYAAQQPASATNSYQATSYAAQPTTTTTSYQATAYAAQPTTTSASYQATSYASQPLTSGYQTYNAYSGQPTATLTGAGAATQALTYGMTGGASSSSVTYGAGHAGDYTSSSRMMTGGERVTSTRKVSSTIIEEQIIGPAPQDLPTREVVVEGPVQDVVKHVTKKEVVETEKRVPKYEYEWVEKIVEVPRFEYVDRTVEVPQYQDVVREVKKTQYVDRPVEVVKEVKVPRVNYIEKIEEIPGQIIEVPKPYTVEQNVEVTRYTDRQHPVVVAQTIKPYIVEGSGEYEVDVYTYEPDCVPVDVKVLKAVQAQLNGQMIESNHRVVTVPAAQYNTILQQLNTHLSQTELQKLPYMTENGQVTFLGERVTYIEPQTTTYIEGLDVTKMVQTHEVRGQVTTQERTTTTTGGAYGASATYGATSTYGATTTGTGYGATGAAYGATMGGSTYGAVLPYTSGQTYQYQATSGTSLLPATGSYQATSGSAYPASSGYQAASSGYQTAEYGASYGTGGRTQYSTMSTGGVRPSASSSVKYQGTVVSS